MANETRVIHQEISRDFRTEIPNIVFELLESGEISPTDLVLYSTYRRIAGEHGACWVGTRGLEKRCGLNNKTITKSKKVLSRKFDLLGGKSLIEITPCDRKKEQADTVIIIDIWRENHEFFKKRLTCSKRSDTGVVKGATRVYQNERQKKEPCKKEPYKNLPLPRSPQIEQKKEEEEKIKIYKILDETILNTKQKERLSREYTEEQVNQAIRISKKHKIKKSLVGMIISIIENPDDWKDETENPNKSLALKYNSALTKIDQKLSQKNEEAIEKGFVIIISKSGTREQISLNSTYFQHDITNAQRYLEHIRTKK